MYLNLKPVAIKRSLESDATKDVEYISISMEVDEESGDKFFIAEKYVLTSTHLFRMLFKEKKELISCKMIVRRRSQLAKESIEANLPEGAAGEMFLSPEQQLEYESFLAVFIVHVYLSDQSYKKVEEGLSTRADRTLVKIEYDKFEKEEVATELKYGWEPDASSVHWKFAIEKYKQPRLRVISTEFLFIDREGESIEANNKGKPAVVFNELLIDEIKKIKLAVLALIIIVALMVVSKYSGR